MTLSSEQAIHLLRQAKTNIQIWYDDGGLHSSVKPETAINRVARGELTAYGSKSRLRRLVTRSRGGAMHERILLSARDVIAEANSTTVGRNVPGVGKTYEFRKRFMKEVHRKCNL